MKPTKIRPRVARQILSALEGGVVPKQGIQHLLVGRAAETEEILSILEQVEDGASEVRIWVGDFGTGKSFMLRTIQQLALMKNFACTTADLTPTRRFQASDGKALALYRELIKHLQTQGAEEGQALPAILLRYLKTRSGKLPAFSGLSLDRGEEWMQLDSSMVQDLRREIFRDFSQFQSGGLAFEFSQALVGYLEALVENRPQKQFQILRWLGGLMETKTEAKKELQIHRIINDDTWTDALQNWAELLRRAGYAGLVANFDELVNLYKLARAQSREQNYERILNLYNDCKGGNVQGLFLNFAATRKAVYDERRGMSSYGALKGRFGLASENLQELADQRSTVQQLKPLSPEEIYTLLEKLQELYRTVYPFDPAFSPQEIARFMQAQLNRPGAEEFLTPRSVIKDFIDLLQLAEQNPDKEPKDILQSRFGRLGVMTRDAQDHDDDLSIEIL